MLDERLAPIVLFVYNRPEHTQQTLACLINNKLASESTLYVFADGPKENATHDERKNIFETRSLFTNLKGFKEVIVYEKENNHGLATSIITGVTEIINKHGKVIVLEDDLLTSPHFLEFMNEGLVLYQNSQNVYSINGYMFKLNYPEYKTVLLPYTSTWGWATWANKWIVFNREMKGKEILINNHFLANRFNIADYKYTEMLNFENNSWGIKWYFSVFVRGGLNVFSTQSLVKNIGFDGSGTNRSYFDELEETLTQEPIIYNQNESIDLDFFDKFVNHFKKEKLSLVKRLINKFKRL